MAAAHIPTERKTAISGCVAALPFRAERARIFGKKNDLIQIIDKWVVIDNCRLVEVEGRLPIARAFAVADELVVVNMERLAETLYVTALVVEERISSGCAMSDGGMASVNDEGSFCDAWPSCINDRFNRIG